MAIKLWRGSYVKKTYPNVWRGTCPQCGRTRVKILWTSPQNNQIKVCKQCRNKKMA